MYISPFLGQDSAHNEKEKIHMKTKFIALFCSCFLLLNFVDAVIPRSEAQIFDNAIRLHILADDNSETAQSVKLLVRDAILAECGTLFENKTNVESAQQELEHNITKMEAIANRVLAENGLNYTAKASWGYEDYPTRVYESVTLPAGKYRSLRINLGSGSGNNWWCILFPPLCTGASSGKKLSLAVNKTDSSVFTSKKYIFRFKLLELFW